MGWVSANPSRFSVRSGLPPLLSLGRMTELWHVRFFFFFFFNGRFFTTADFRLVICILEVWGLSFQSDSLILFGMDSRIVSGLPCWDMFGAHPETLDAAIALAHHFLSVSVEWE